MKKRRAIMTKSIYGKVRINRSRRKSEERKKKEEMKKEED
jgi:hypothetical protein